jgi:parallel beta-helix repeat protein
MKKTYQKRIQPFFYIALSLLFTTGTNLLSANLTSYETIGEENRKVNVKDFGAKGDGMADDTDAINAAVAESVNGMVQFPRGTYRITETIDIVLKENGLLGLSGVGASARIIMEGDGPAFRFTGSHHGTASPASVTSLTWEKERMPLVYALEIIGNHPKAVGLEFQYTHMPVVNSVLIRNMLHGIHITSRNRNVIITDSHIYDCSGVGIYLDSVNLHQIIISNSHISYNRRAGIKVFKSEIRNIQITGNDIEYNCTGRSGTSADVQVSADIWIDCADGGSVREGTISGNTIQALPGADGANIRFTGLSGNNRKIGLLSVTGNHISSQTVNIHLDQTHGISITGNTFIRGYDHNIKVDNSRNVIINANVFDHNNDYAPGGEVYAPGGITIFNSDNIILGDNIIDGVDYEAGGAITVNDSREISLRGNHISNPKYLGIQINHSSNVRVTDCRVFEDVSIPAMRCSIELNGNCSGTIIRNNSIVHGEKGDIVNHSTGGVLIEGNTTDN